MTMVVGDEDCQPGNYMDVAQTDCWQVEQCDGTELEFPGDDRPNQCWFRMVAVSGWGVMIIFFVLYEFLHCERWNCRGANLGSVALGRWTGHRAWMMDVVDRFELVPYISARSWRRR